MTDIHPLESLYSEELYKIQRKVLVIIPRPWVDVQEEEKILLGKILSAVKLSLASVQIINRTQFEVLDFKAYRPECIISFGSALKSGEKMYERITANGTAIVVADELRQLDEVRKKNLWLTLKEVFHF